MQKVRRLYHNWRIEYTKHIKILLRPLKFKFKYLNKHLKSKSFCCLRKHKSKRFKQTSKINTKNNLHLYSSKIFNSIHRDRIFSSKMLYSNKLSSNIHSSNIFNSSKFSSNIFSNSILSNSIISSNIHRCNLHSSSKHKNNKVNSSIHSSKILSNSCKNSSNILFINKMLSNRLMSSKIPRLIANNLKSCLNPLLHLNLVRNINHQPWLQTLDTMNRLKLNMTKWLQPKKQNNKDKEPKFNPNLSHSLNHSHY